MVIVVEKNSCHSIPSMKTMEWIPSACEFVEVNAFKFGIMQVGYQICIGCQ